MLVDINFDEKNHETFATFELKNIENERSIKELLAIITMISADYYLDPEIGIEDVQNFIASVDGKNKTLMTFSINEEGLELEFK
jgi:hypothetical protein